MTEKTQEVNLDTIDNILEEAKKNNFDNIVIIGHNNNGVIDIATNLPQYPFLQYLLNRASFELSVHERSQMNAREGDKGQDA